MRHGKKSICFLKDGWEWTFKSITDFQTYFKDRVWTLFRMIFLIKHFFHWLLDSYVILLYCIASHCCNTLCNTQHTNIKLLLSFFNSFFKETKISIHLMWLWRKRLRKGFQKERSPTPPLKDKCEINRKLKKLLHAIIKCFTLLINFHNTIYFYFICKKSSFLCKKRGKVIKENSLVFRRISSKFVFVVFFPFSSCPSNN